jgi:hypothetical protein
MEPVKIRYCSQDRLSVTSAPACQVKLYMECSWRDVIEFTHET